MNPTIIQLSKGRLCLVSVPEGATNFTLIQSHSYFNSPRLEHSIGGVDLPREIGGLKNWQFIATDQIVTEEQAREIVDELDQIVITYYPDYTAKGKVCFKALDSLRSLLTHHNIKQCALLFEPKKY